jgi:hypothetical protein
VAPDTALFGDSTSYARMTYSARGGTLIHTSGHVGTVVVIVSAWVMGYVWASLYNRLSGL